MYLFQKIVLCPARKSYFPENRTLQKIVLVFHFPRKSYLFFVFFRKMYLFSENRTIILYPLSHNGFRKFGFQKFVLIFTFLENYLHKYIQRIYILLIFVPNNNNQLNKQNHGKIKTNKKDYNDHVKILFKKKQRFFVFSGIKKFFGNDWLCGRKRR